MSLRHEKRRVGVLRAVLSGGAIFILSVALGCVARAQNERNNNQRPANRAFSPAPKASPDTWCQYSLSAIDKMVCADRGLLQKHIHVDDMQRLLENAAGFPKMLRIWQLHGAWLNAREQCAGPDVIACLARLYDARIEELAGAIVIEEQSKQ